MNLKLNLKSEAGFSLIELMLVIAIIGVMATISFEGYSHLQAKARASESKAQLAALFMAQGQFRAEWNGFHTDALAVGFRPNGQLRYVIGFNAASSHTVAGYTGPALDPNNLSTGVVGLCPLMGCANIAIGPNGLPITAVSLATTAAITTFTAAAEGFVGGSQVDVWSINEGKVLTNTTPGGY